MKMILVIALLIPTIIFAQEYNKYSCLAEQILNDCESKDIMLYLGNNMWKPLPENDRNVQSLSKYIESKENEYKQMYLNKAAAINHYDYALYCQKPDEYEKTNISNSLSYNQNRFLWLGSQVDCALNFIKFEPSISFFSFAPFSINLFPITIIGGIGIGIGIGRTILFIIKRKN